MIKNLISLSVALLAIVNLGFAQNMAHKGDMMKKEEVKSVTLEQTTGAFTTTELNLEAGTYQFEIVNNNVGKEVGFVLASAENPDEHIKEAYVTEMVQNNTSEKTNVVNLAPGEYVYYCPMNPTPQYKLTVK